jgi:hypothetical protein
MGSNVFSTFAYIFSDLTIILYRLPTPVLLRVVTPLIHSTTPIWLKHVLTNYLSLVPLNRSLGVKHIIEFITDTSPGKGLQLKELQQASNLIGSIPSTLSSPEEYFGVIGPRLLKLLDVPSTQSSIGYATAYIIGTIVEKRKKATANNLISPIIEDINPSLSKDIKPGQVGSEVLVAEMDPNATLNALLLKPVSLALWALLSFTHKTNKSHWHSIVEGVLQSYFKVSASVLELDQISQNLLFDGDSDWYFANGDLGGVEIRKRITKDSNISLDDITMRAQDFLDLLSDVDEGILNELFLRICRRWLSGKLDVHENDSEENAFK